MAKKIFGIITCLIFSCLIVFGIPFLYQQSKVIALDYTDTSIIAQDITGYSKDKETYYKLYNNGQLVGVITNMDTINDGIAEDYKKYEDEFPGTTLGLLDDLYIVEEDSYNIFENVDDQIMDYIIDNDLLGIKTNAIEFSTDGGVYDIIYVNSLDDFTEARDDFLLNFVSEDTLKALSENKKISGPTDFGTTEMNLSIAETMTFTDAFVAPDKIYTSVSEIYNYLCYGRTTERQYYETVEGDTLQGVGAKFQNMSSKQVMMINPDKIFSEDQVLEPGMVLNVTYFSSPLTITVTKERLSQETVYADNPIYNTDSSLPAGTTRIDVEESNGSKNVLYEEKWVNGVLQSGSELSSVVVKEAVQAVITVGTQKVVSYGSGNYIWPVDNPTITCAWGCYYGHTGTDIVNSYNRYGPIYAIDTGTVAKATYNGIDGNFVEIDHGNDIFTHYGHMSKIVVSVGDVVQRGDIIGYIGMTGVATGPHVHLHFIVNGVITDACTIMDCTSISWS